MIKLEYPAFLARRTAHLEPQPARDWRLLLGIALLVLAVVVGWHLWIFRAVVEGAALDVPPTPTSNEPVIDTGPVQAVRTLYEQRAAEEAKYVNGTYTYTDPSQL